MATKVQSTLDRMGLKQRVLCDLFGLSRASVSRKVAGLRPWSATEIHQLIWFFQQRDSSISYESLFGKPKRLRRAEPVAVAR